jgi:GntR family transcriptional regulator/MocR family aminotransferase
MSLARRLALLDLAERSRAVVVEDDYDSEFRYEGRPVESLQGLDRSGLVVYAGTFSKSVLAGLRIGFMILPRPLLPPFTAAKSLWDSGTPVLEQAALAEFMRSGDFERHIRRMRRLYAGRRDALLASLGAHLGDRGRVGAHHSGLNMLVTLDVGCGEDDLVREAAGRSIALPPASRYFTRPPNLPTFLLGFGGMDEATIEQGVAALAELITDLQGHEEQIGRP